MLEIIQPENTIIPTHRDVEKTHVGNNNNNIEPKSNKQHTENAERNAKWFAEIFALTTKNSQDALKYDGNCLKAWLDQNPDLILNTDLINNEDVLKQYFTEMIASDLKRSTIVRQKTSIKKLLKGMMLANPFTANSLFNDWLKLALNKKPSAKKQAQDMGNKSLEMINSKLSNDCPLDLRNKLILNIAFDALLRAEEVCAIKIEHIDFSAETLFIPSSKTDKEGEGEYLFLSNTTLTLIGIWLALLTVKNGYLLRSLSPKKHIRSAPIKYRTVLDAFRSASVLAGKEYGYYTGHSGRVGAAVTLAESGATLFDIQRAGRWASEHMPAVYTKKASAKLTGMGKVAKQLGR